MTKRFDRPASFNPSTGVIDASNIPYFDPGLALAIVNTTARGYLYDIVTPGLGYAGVTGSVLTVEAATAGMSSNDNVLIIWDPGLGSAVSDQESAPFSGVVPMTPGVTYAAQRSVLVVASTDGIVMFQLADGSAVPRKVYAGSEAEFPYACTQILTSGTTATAVYYNQK